MICYHSFQTLYLEIYHFQKLLSHIYIIIPSSFENKDTK